MNKAYSVCHTYDSFAYRSAYKQSLPTKYKEIESAHILHISSLWLRLARLHFWVLLRFAVRIHLKWCKFSFRFFLAMWDKEESGLFPKFHVRTRTQTEFEWFGRNVCFLDAAQGIQFQFDFQSCVCSTNIYNYFATHLVRCTLTQIKLVYGKSTVHPQTRCYREFPNDLTLQTTPGALMPKLFILWTHTNG